MGRKYNRLGSSLLYFGIPTLIYLTFIFGGFIFVFIESLGYIEALDMRDISFRHYYNVFSDADFLKSCLFSLYLATVSSTISVSIGVYLAQLITFSEHKKINLLFLKLSNIFIILPYLFTILLVIWMFSDSGLLARILHVFGFENDLGILYDDFGLGMIFAFVLKGSAFVTVYVYNVMSKIKKDYLILGQSMGVSKGKIIRSVYIPICRNTIVWSSAILFAYTLGSYEVPMLLSNIKQDTLATELYKLYTSSNFSDFPQAMATNISMLFINLVFASLYALAVSKVIKRGYQ